MQYNFRTDTRFYHLYEQSNFFGTISLICSWGAFNSKRGNHKIIFCNDKEELDKTITKIVKTRKQRGYSRY